MRRSPGRSQDASVAGGVARGALWWRRGLGVMRVSYGAPAL